MKIIHMLVVGLACLPVYFAIAYKNIMPNEPKLQTNLSDSEFQNNYGNDVFQAFLRLPLPPKSLASCRHNDFLHYFTGKVDPRICIAMTFENTNAEEVFKNTVMKNVAPKWTGEILQNDDTKEYYDAAKHILITVKNENSKVRCYIQQAEPKEVKY